MHSFNLKAADAFGKIFNTGTITQLKSRMSVAESPHLEHPVSLTEALQGGRYLLSTRERECVFHKALENVCISYELVFQRWCTIHLMRSLTLQLL